MALPAPVVEQLSRRVSPGRGVLGQLLMFGISVFVITLIIYGGMRLGYRPILQNQVDDLKVKIDGFSQGLGVEQQQEIIRFYSQIANLKTLLANRAVISPIFPWLEKNTVTSVQFTKFGYSQQSHTMNLSGTTRTVRDVASQLYVFQNAPEVARVNVGQVNANDKGVWSFDMSIVFNNRFPAITTPQTTP